MLQSNLHQQQNNSLVVVVKLLFCMYMYSCLDVSMNASDSSPLTKLGYYETLKHVLIFAGAHSFMYVIAFCTASKIHQLRGPIS